MTQLKDLLVQQRAAILEDWLQRILESYPADASRFLRKELDCFQNPVGSTISREIEFLYDSLLGDLAPEHVAEHLDPVVRIRAVQDFSPAEAIGFIFLLKRVVRQQLEGEIRQNRAESQLLDFESRIDDLALQAFNLYVQCREQIYQLRAKEIKNQTYTLLERATRVKQEPLCGVDEPSLRAT